MLKREGRRWRGKRGVDSAEGRLTLQGETGQESLKGLLARTRPPPSKGVRGTELEERRASALRSSWETSTKSSMGEAGSGRGMRDQGRWSREALERGSLEKRSRPGESKASAKGGAMSAGDEWRGARGGEGGRRLGEKRPRGSKISKASSSDRPGSKLGSKLEAASDRWGWVGAADGRQAIKGSRVVDGRGA